MEIIKKGDIHEVKFQYDYGDWEQWILLMSDEHYDSTTCDRKLLTRHHEEAKRLNAPIFKFGDIFDCCQGKGDPRAMKAAIRPEHCVDDYFDEIGRDAAKFYAKYDIAFVSPGNHEESVLKHRETNLTKNLAERLGCARGDYSGWLRFSFYNKDGAAKRKLDLYYNHEGGGNSPVSKGAINTNRNGVNYNADIYVTGHNHNRWEIELVSEGIDKMGNVKRKEQMHINTGTYQMKPIKDRQRWDSKYGQPNLGGVFLRFRVEGQSQKITARAMLA